jgi:hypothetical protein
VSKHVALPFPNLNDAAALQTEARLGLWDILKTQEEMWDIFKTTQGMLVDEYYQMDVWAHMIAYQPRCAPA